VVVRNESETAAAWSPAWMRCMLAWPLVEESEGGGEKGEAGER
jgi:hypothetical protein